MAATKKDFNHRKTLIPIKASPNRPYKMDSKGMKFSKFNVNL
jgi:hypothetical protein